jgi:hypothetical protein
LDLRWTTNIQSSGSTIPSSVHLYFIRDSSWFCHLTIRRVGRGPLSSHKSWLRICLSILVSFFCLLNWISNVGKLKIHYSNQKYNFLSVKNYKNWQKSM